MRTGARAASLEGLLIRVGLKPVSTAPPVPDVRRLPSDQAARVEELYRILGGTATTPRLRPGPWDMTFEGNVVVELDEELHFNRYRQLTLEPGWAEALPWRDDYLRYCERREGQCLKAATWGARWTNPSCESLFGPPGTPGDLAAAGAPRWKQRALYDAMKDLAASGDGGIRLARLATVDVVSGVPLGDVLQGRAAADPDDLRQLLDQRLA